MNLEKQDGTLLVAPSIDSSYHTQATISLALKPYPVSIDSNDDFIFSATSSEDFLGTYTFEVSVARANGEHRIAHPDPLLVVVSEATLTFAQIQMRIQTQIDSETDTESFANSITLPSPDAFEILDLDTIVSQFGTSPYLTYASSVSVSDTDFSYAINLDQNAASLSIGPFSNHLYQSSSLQVTLRITETSNEAIFPISVTVLSTNQKLSFS